MFFGHDALVMLELEGSPQLLEIRTTGRAPEPGERVRVRVEGAVVPMN
jgi:hypothetical protein